MIKLLTLFIVFSSVSMATTILPKERRLKKLSMHIRGITPTPKEYKALSTIPDLDLEAYFLYKTDEYLKHENHSSKMNSRLNQLYNLSLPRFYMGSETHFEEDNALNNLFKKIATENLSWDELLIGKTYDLTAYGNRGFEGNDFAFLGAMINTEIPHSESGILFRKRPVNFFSGSTDLIKKESISFGANDSRIAGSLTTQRFFLRNVNTALNKNRKRAAAVFRIFLCDEMKAAIPQNENNFDYVLDYVFPDTTGMSQEDISATLLNDDHGTRADCMSCHYKLDPMGKNFGGSATALAPTSFNGALTYKTKRGNIVDIKTSGLGDMAQALVEQKDYKACQTKRFWNWYIGEDRLLDDQTNEELIKKYEELDGKTNDFIKYLVNRKEFYELKNLTQIGELARKVKTTLKNCNVCHQAMGIPDFDKWPIEGRGEDMKYWVNRISARLGLDGGVRTMPPSYHVWQPTDEDLDNIKSWIEIGAPDEDGNTQID